MPITWNTKSSLERLWSGQLNIYEYVDTVDPDTKQTRQGEVLVHENVPCRVSFKLLYSNDTTFGAPTTQQTLTLFTTSEIEIKSGSKLVVSQNGRTVEYKRSGIPAIYSSHQEVPLVPYEDYA